MLGPSLQARDKTTVHEMEALNFSSFKAKEGQVVPSAGKVTASVFWDAKGILLIDYLQKGKTINRKYYAYLLRQLQKKTKSKRCGKLTKGVLLQQNNLPAHKSVVAMFTVCDCRFELLDNFSHSSDYFLFLNMKILNHIL